MLSFPFVFLKYLFIANDSLPRPNEIWNNKWEHIAFEAHPCLLTMRPCQISPSTNNRHDSCSRPGRRHTKAAHCFQVSIRLLSLRFQDSFKPHISTRRCVLRFWGLAAMLWHLNFFQPSYSSHKLKPVSKVEFCHWEWPRGWWALLLWSSDPVLMLSQNTILLRWLSNIYWINLKLMNSLQHGVIQCDSNSNTINIILDTRLKAT